MLHDVRLGILALLDRSSRPDCRHRLAHIAALAVGQHRVVKTFQHEHLVEVTMGVDRWLGCEIAGSIGFDVVERGFSSGDEVEIGPSRMTMSTIPPRPRHRADRTVKELGL